MAPDFWDSPGKTHSYSASSLWNERSLAAHSSRPYQCFMLRPHKQELFFFPFLPFYLSVYFSIQVHFVPSMRNWKWERQKWGTCVFAGSWVRGLPYSPGVVQGKELPSALGKTSGLYLIRLFTWLLGPHNADRDTTPFSCRSLQNLSLISVFITETEDEVSRVSH